VKPTDGPCAPFPCSCCRDPAVPSLPLQFFAGVVFFWGVVQLIPEPRLDELAATKKDLGGAPARLEEGGRGKQGSQNELE
jgi:hypothetical protein